MAVVMRVGAALDDKATQKVAERAEKYFADAGARAGSGFGRSFEEQVERALSEKTLQKSARKLEAQMTRTGKTSGEAFNQAIANEAVRTGQAADKIGQALTQHLGVHGGTAGRQFTQTFMGEIGKAVPGVGNAMESVGKVGTMAMEAIGGSAVAVTAGVVAIGVAAVAAGVKLYDIGASFDNVSKSVEIQTGKMGSELAGLTDSIDHVATVTASSLGDIGNIAGAVTQAFHVSGEPLENLTKQIADLNRMTGEQTNVRDLGKVMRAFGLDASVAGGALDELKVASENTGAPVNELLQTLKTVGASARSLHLDFGQTAAMIDMFDQAGLDASTTTRSMNHAITEATKAHVDLRTALDQGIQGIQDFLAAGNEQGAQELAQKLFGSRGAQQFLDAIRQGKLNVDDLNRALQKTADAGHIEKLNDDTMRWGDTWTIVKNRIEDALRPLTKPVFDWTQKALRWVSGYHPEDHDAKSVDPGADAKNPAAPGTPGADGGDGSSLSDQLNDTGHPKVVLPYGPGYGAGPAAGESEEHYRLQQTLIEKQHDLAVKRAEVDEMDKSHVASEEDKLQAHNDLQKAQGEAGTAQRALSNSMTATVVPYSAAYGAAPRPNESAGLYSAEQSSLEAQHKRAQAQATLNQLETNAGVSTEQKIKARNDLAAAEKDEYEAQIKLREASLGTGKSLGELGAAIDNDFGISKGIPGIVENLVKTIANVAAAPMLGQLQAITNANEAQTGITGGYGIMGIMGAQNLANGRSAITGQPLDSPSAITSGPAGFVSNTGTGSWLGNLGGVGGTGLSGGSFGVGEPATPGVASAGYPGDAALLAQVPHGKYDASGDLTKGLGDCSSAVEDLVNIMDGAPTAGRGMATGNAAQWLPAHGFLPTNQPMPGSFQVGFSSSHMQATLPGGTPFNWGSDAAAAQGGVGGSGAWDPSFTSHYYRPAGGVAGAPGGAGGAALGPGAGVISVFVTNMPGGMGLGAPGGPAAAGAAGAGGAAGGAAGAAPGPSGGGGSGGGRAVGPGTATQWRTNEDGSKTGLDASGNATGDYMPSGMGSPGAPGSIAPGLTSPGAATPPAPAPAPTPPPALPAPITNLFGPTAPGGPPGEAADSGVTGLMLPPPDGGTGKPPSRADLAPPSAAPTPAPPPALTPTTGLHPAGGGTGVAGPSAGLLVPHPGGGAAPGPASAPGEGPTKIGGGEPPSNPSGGQAGITPGGSIDTAISLAASAIPGLGPAAQIGEKLANRAIQYGAQAAGIAAGGLMETFLPTGGSDLASNSWLTKIAGGLAGARPAVPNSAGGAGKKPLTGKEGGKEGNGKPAGDVTQNVTINQASHQPANDAAHVLGVQAQATNHSAPAMGR